MSNLINNDQPPPPDTAPFAAAAEEAAKTNHDSNIAFLARQKLQELRFRTAQYTDNQDYVNKVNESILAAQRAEQEQQTKAVAAVGTLAVADLALNNGPGMVASVFSGASARNKDPEAEPTTREMGPAAAFAGRATKVATLAAILGRQGPAETMVSGAPFMAAAALTQIADPKAPDPSVNDPAPNVPRINQPRPVNNAYALTNDAMSKGPRPPSWATGTNGGSSTA